MHQTGDHGERQVQVFGQHPAPQEQVEDVFHVLMQADQSF